MVERSTPHSHSNTPYILAIITLIVAVLVAIIVITKMRPEHDNMELFVLIVGMMSTIVVAFLGFIKSNEAVEVSHDTQKTTLETKAIQVETQGKQEELHSIVNSRMTEMMEVVRKLALAQGIEEGIRTGAEREIKRAGEMEKSRVEGIATGEEDAAKRVETEAEIIREYEDDDTPPQVTLK